MLRNRKKTMPKVEDVRKNYLEMIYLYQIESKETVEDMVKKQALLEALFGTQLWQEPYLEENPFFYVTPRE